MRNCRLAAALAGAALLAGSALLPSAAGAAPSFSPGVRVSPAVVVAGKTMRVTGAAWRPGARVQLAVGPPASEADPVRTLTVDATGRFATTIRFQPAADPGRYVLLARCVARCSDRATASFRITKGVTSDPDWSQPKG